MTDYIDEKVKKLIINQLTKEEFIDLSSEDSEGIPSPNKVYIKDSQVYLVPDDTEEQLEDIYDRLDNIEYDLYSSEGLIQDIKDDITVINNDITNIYNTAVLSHESSEPMDPEYDGYIMYCGTSTEVMGQEDWV